MKNIAGRVLFAFVGVALVGCSPSLQGVCSADSDCKSGESCSDGICLSAAPPDAGDKGDAGNPGDAGDGGNTSDAGDAGNQSDAGDAGNPGGDGGGATVAIVSPDGGYVGGTFQVAAQTSAAGTINFDLVPAVGGSSKGGAAVAATAAGTFGGTVTVAAGFSGQALLQATLHSGAADYKASSVSITVDQTGPNVSTAFDGTKQWVAADGGFTFTANVSDDLSGVGAAQVSVLQSSTAHLDYPASSIDAGSALFIVPAKQFAVARAAAIFPFTLSATDKVNNPTTAPLSASNIFRVDDQPPVISPVVAVGGPWFRAQVPFTASISDGSGSGVKASSIALAARTTSTTGSFDADAGVASFNADFSTLVDGGYEGLIFYQVTAMDNVGNSSAMDGSVSMDNVPPSVAVAAVTAADVTVGATAWYGGDGGAITIYANVDGGAGSPIDGTSLSVDVGSGMPPNLGESKYSFDIPRAIATGLQGPHTFNVRAADLAGNQSSAALTLNFDTLPPVLLPASLVAPTGWVKRADAAVSAEFLVHDRGVGPSAVVLQTLDGKTTLATFTNGSDTTSFKGSFPLGWTPAGTEKALSYRVVALDQLQNASTATYQILIDDVPPVITPDPSNAANTGWHSTQAGNLSFNATAVITDSGSLVAAALMGPVPGNPPATGNIWTFPVTLSSDPTLETNRLPVTVTASDHAGNNSGDVTNFFYMIDNKRPSITGVSIATAPDGIAGSVNWYRGADNVPPTTTIDVTATITDTYLDGASPVATLAGAKVVSGAPDTSNPNPIKDLWHFLIPRAVGANGPVVIALDALDLANNHAAITTLSINFDDGAGASFSPAISIDTAWYARTNASGNASQLPVTATFATLPPSGLQSVLLSDSTQANQGPASHTTSTWQFTLPTTDAPAGEGSYSFNITATSVVGVTTTVAGTRNIDGKPPGIVPDTASAQNAAWHGVQANTLRFTASAVITDNGSGVMSATMGSGTVAVATGKVPPSGSSAWTFLVTLPSDATVETNKYGPVAVTALDNVNNSSSDTTDIFFMLDNKPPVWSAIALDAATAGDATDLAGRKWFKGKSFFAGAAPAILVDASLTEGYISTATATPPGGVAVSGCVGTAPTYSCQFQIPRVAMSNAPSAPYTINLAAADLAGNKSSPASLGFNIDDQKSFPATAVADSNYYSRISAVLRVSTSPPSGFPIKAGAFDPAGTAKLTIGSCSGASAIPADPGSTIAAFPSVSSLAFIVPVSTCVGSNIDGAVPFSVTVTSLVGGTGVALGNVNVDTRGPVIGGFTGLYPAAGGNAVDWSHDGSHFNRRDSGALFSFLAYDCHGLNTNAARVSITGLSGLASYAVAPDSSGTLNPGATCSSPAGVTVYRFTASGDLSAVATSALPFADNALNWSVSLSDSNSNVTNSGSTINVTRRLWKAAVPQTVSFLSLGPSLFASGSGGITSLDPVSGANASFASGGQVESPIATNNGTPSVIYSVGKYLHAGNAAQPSGADFGSCFKGDMLDGFALTSATTVSYTSESQVFAGNCDPTCSIVDACGPTRTCASCPGCWNYRTAFYQSQLTLSGGSVACSSFAPAPGVNCAGSPSGPAGLSNRIQSAIPSLLYLGQSGSNDWALQDSNGSSLGSYGAPLASGHGWPMIDGSSPPNAYLPGIGNNPGRIDVVQFSSSGFVLVPFSLPSFPGAISDMLLAQSGILYVLSNNIAHAVITDSAGGATASGGPQTNAWPSACHDPCASSLAGYVCPY